MKYEVKSYANKNISWSFYSDQESLKEKLNFSQYVDWFEKFKGMGIVTEINEISNGNRDKVFKIKTFDLETLIDQINYKIFKEAKPKILGENVSYKRWTRIEDNFILTYNPKLSHGQSELEEVAPYLPDRTIGAISERIKIIRHTLKHGDIEELYRTTDPWTTEEESKLLSYVDKEEFKLSYDLTSVLMGEFPNKSCHNIRSKIRQLTGRLL